MRPLKDLVIEVSTNFKKPSDANSPVATAIEQLSKKEKIGDYSDYLALTCFLSFVDELLGEKMPKETLREFCDHEAAVPITTLSEWIAADARQLAEKTNKN